MVSAIELLLNGDKMGKPIYRWFKDATGLGVRINKSGVTVYVVKYSLNGRQKLDTLGSTDVYTREQARSLVERMRALARQGIDPNFLLVSLVDSSGIHSSTCTFGKFAEDYLSRHAKEKKRSWLKDKQRIDLYLKDWKNLPLTSITSKMAQQVHQKLKSTPYAANRMLEQISWMFKIAVKWGYLPLGFANPAAEIEYYREEPRERFIKKQEMVMLARVLSLYPHPIIVSAIKFELYTGLRTTELLTLRWSDVDLYDRYLNLPGKRTKSRKTHTLPLSDQAVRVLMELFDKRDPQNPYVFPGGRPGTHLNRIDKHWRIIRKLAGLDDVRFHDLRRTVGSWVVQKTGKVAVVSEILNHTQEYTTSIYARYGRDDVRSALDSLGSEIDQFLGS